MKSVKLKAVSKIFKVLLCPQAVVCVHITCKEALHRTTNWHLMFKVIFSATEFTTALFDVA